MSKTKLTKPTNLPQRKAIVQKQTRHFQPLVRPGSRMQVGRPNDKFATQVVSTVLLELVCTGCLQSIYRPLMMMQHIPEDIGQYPDLESLENQLGEGLRHVAPVYTSEEHREKNLESGYSQCGYYKAVRVWKEWEDPERYAS